VKKHCQELIRLLAMKVSGNKVLTYDDGSNHHGSEQFNEGSTGSNFVEDAVDEMYREDGLLVMARGLGIHRVASKFLEYYGDDRAKGRLVFCLNAVGGDENFLFEDWFEDDSESTALSSRRTKVIRSDVLQADRSRFYAAGGCFLISTQIILADLLQKKVDASRIAGFLVLNAHRVTESSNEAFVIRIFKQENKFGFVKAFSDAPETLASGFMKVDRLCKNLFVRRLFLYPRFKDTVEKCLDPLPPEVIEFIQPLTSSMKACQTTVLVLMSHCLNALQSAAPQYLDKNMTTLEAGLFDHFDSTIKSHLNAHWHSIPKRAIQFLRDIKEIRTLMTYLLHLDAINFYEFLINLHSASRKHSIPSLWLGATAADKLFTTSKERVFTTIEIRDTSTLSKRGRSLVSAFQLKERLKPRLEVPPKWKLFQEIMKEILSCRLDTRKNSTEEKYGCLTFPKIVILVKDYVSAKMVESNLRLDYRETVKRSYNSFISRQCTKIKRKITSFSASTKVGPQQLKQPQRQKQMGFNSGFLMSNSSNGGEGDRSRGVDFDIKAARQLSSFEKMMLLEEVLIQDDAVDKSDGTDSNVSQSLFLNEIFTHHFVEPSNKKNANLESIGTRRSNEMHSEGSNGKKRKKWSHLENGNTESEEQSAFTIAERNIIGEAYTTSDSRTDIDCESTNFSGDPAMVDVTIIRQCQLEKYSNCLRRIKPSHIIMYDPDLSAIRTVEVYQSELLEKEAAEQINESGANCISTLATQEGGTSMQPDNRRVKVMFMMYDQSSDEHKYVAAVEKERQSFEKLIEAKANMVVSLQDLPRDIQDARKEHSGTAFPLALDTRTHHGGGKKKNSSTTVVVDIRELKSGLPNQLHSSGLEIFPQHLVVGDYILSPQLCFERKGISDLFQSLDKGRLYKQAEAMQRHYSSPCLLIEFSSDRSFSLQSHHDVPDDVRSGNIISKMVTLVQSFPKLAIFWSRSSLHTAEIFKNLKIGKDDPDIDKAIAAGNEGNDDKEDEFSSKASESARSMLRALPGINDMNIRNVLTSVENLAELSAMNVTGLSPLVGPENAQKLFKFFRQHLPSI
jgi:DNA excision repair protein ERCC-4